MLTDVERLHIRQANKFIERIQPKWAGITQRFFMYCIAKVNDNKEHFEVLEIDLADLPKILGYGENTKLMGTELKEIHEQLHKNSCVQIIDDVSKNYRTVYLFQELDFSTTKGRIKILFSDAMRDQVLQLRKKKLAFTDIAYKEVMPTRGSYSVRLTELLHQYKKIGHRLFKLAELRTLLGVPEGSYKVFKDFRKNVIDQAVNEINNNEKSTITVSYETIRVGRSVGEIYFIITKRKKMSQAAVQLILLEAENETAATVKDPDEPFLRPYLEYGNGGSKTPKKE